MAAGKMPFMARTILARAGVKYFQLEGGHIGLHWTFGAFWMKAGINGRWVILANGGVKKTSFRGVILACLLRVMIRKNCASSLVSTADGLKPLNTRPAKLRSFIPM